MADAILERPSTPQDPVMIERVTRGGSRLFYRMVVMQNPDRARACGTGRKSANDRRPVDPPPVLELRVFEGPTFETARDITFSYKANFLLFCTLEHARPLAHGRILNPVNQTPVISGSTVAGMAYLDRPHEAGYFLFTDLSVRHEGMYKLRFSLFEQTSEDKDKDPLTPGAPDMAEYFSFRMDIYSADFQVYSAKRFPGLPQSTSLSETMASQGTKVRIRRDIRLRRREKPKDQGKGQGEGQGQGQGERQSSAMSRDGSRERRPSTQVDTAAQNPGSQRRPSAVEYAPASAPPNPPPPPGFPSTQVPGTGHLSFGAAAGYGAAHGQYHHRNTSGHNTPVPQSPAYSTVQSPVYAPPQSPSYAAFPQQAAQSPMHGPAPLQPPAYPTGPVYHHSTPQPPTPLYLERRQSDQRIAPQHMYPKIAPQQPLPSPQRDTFFVDGRRMSAAAQLPPIKGFGEPSPIKAVVEYKPGPGTTICDPPLVAGPLPDDRWQRPSEEHYIGRKRARDEGPSRFNSTFSQAKNGNRPEERKAETFLFTVEHPLRKPPTQMVHTLYRDKS